MIRLLILVAVVFAAVLGFEWLKDAPGELALTVNERVYAVGLARAALVLLMIVAAALIVIWLLSLIWTAPARAARAWRNNRQENIRSMLARGLLAVAAGDMRAAERAATEAMKRAPGAPLTRLLQAQVAEVKGDNAGAEAAFTAMLADPRTRVAGLRGMHIEAERAGNAAAARHYAEAAQQLAPGAAWANRALMRTQIAAGDWDGALSTLAVSADNRGLDRKTLRRHRAVILTAKAMQLEDSDPQKAQQLAMEAHSLSPDLAPAATLAGRLLARLGDIRRAAKVLETGWKAAPHPDIADAYAHVRSGDSARDRLKRVDALMRMRPQADEGRLALVRAAIDTRDWTLARSTLRPLLVTRPTQNAFVLMAEIEEGEHGDRGRAREFLSRAVRAPRDPAWVADGMVLSEWAPASPISGRIDGVEWRVPAERLGGPEAIEVDEDALRPTPLLPVASAPVEAKHQPRTEPAEPAPGQAGAAAKRRGAGDGGDGEDAEVPRPAMAVPVAPAAAAEPVGRKAGAEPAANGDGAATERGDDRAASDTAPAGGSDAETTAEPAAGEKVGAPTGDQVPGEEDGTIAAGTAMGEQPAAAPANGSETRPASTSAAKGEDDGDGDQLEDKEPPDPITLPRPDDPGVDDAEPDAGQEPERRRFRLF